jgi:hypothetical protein
MSKRVMSISAATKTRLAERQEKNNVVDTTFVLFFLALEFGRTFGILSLDNLFIGIALLGLMIMPYWLKSERESFTNWMFGRSLITSFGLLAGVIFNQSLGGILPDSFKYLPLTLLLLTAFLSCYFQLYSFLKIRVVK